MDTLYIIDAVNFLFRSYYAIGNMTNEQGQSTGALFGFIRSLQKIRKDFSPSHLICVFDGPDNKRSRQSVYAEYKMHRKGAPEDLFPQFEWAYEYCEAAGISTICVEGVEADDTMATAALWAEKKGAKVFLCSSDKDLAQLVNDQIFLLQPHKDNLIIDTQKVEEIYGVRPNQILDYLAIMGDASDNIPGLEGFGPKTASSLLKEFGSLDEILAHPEKVKGEKKQEILRTQKDQALLSRELATLNQHVPIPEEEEFYRIKPAQTDRLKELFQRMKFNSLLRELEQAPQETPSLSPKKAQTHAIQYQLVDTPEDLHRLLHHDLGGAKEAALDTETTALSPLLAELVGIGFCTEPGKAWYVPLNGQLGKDHVLKELRPFFQQTQCRFYGHNLKYDLHILANVGISVPSICFDTLLASYLLEPQNRKHNLDELTLNTFQKVKIPIEELIGKGKNQITMREVPLEKVKEYCCEDVDYTCRLKEQFEEEIRHRKLESILQEIELPLLPILEKMERVGIYLDVEQLKEQGHVLSKELHELKEKIFKEVGHEFNLNSPKQLSEVLYQEMGIQPPGKKKTEFSTGAEVLEELATDHPIARLILDYRGLEKLRSTYIEALPEQVNPNTGRIHCNFNQSVAATGRLSCQDPNLQNIPVRTPEGLAIRSCFKPQKTGWSFLGADYSQIELRLLAHFCEDPELLKAFQTGLDIHAHTASLVFKVPIQAVTADMRAAAKTVNFGILYGQGPYGLSQQLHISHREAADFIKAYFEQYPKVQEYLEACKEQVRKSGVAKTLLGRQRPIPEMNNKNAMIRSAAERLAINTPLQGTAADLIKKAMIEIDQCLQKRSLQGKMILQIHDELIFEIPDAEIPDFQILVKEKMEHVLSLNVPIEVQMAVGKNWAEC